MLRFLKALLMSAAGLVGWFGRMAFQGLTGRSLAQEAADQEAAQAREDAAADAQAQAQADRVEAAARHEETATLAQQHVEETRALREELGRLARRREEIARQSRSHDPEIRSFRWETDEPEPEGGAPVPAYA